VRNDLDATILRVAQSKHVFKVQNMQFTLSLPKDAASRIAKLTELTGGSVGGYAGAWAELISMLPTWEQEELRALVKAKIMQLSSRPSSAGGGIGAVPAIPIVLPRRAGRLRREEELRNRGAEMRPVHPNTPNEKSEGLASASDTPQSQGSVSRS
jgi:hypothetical protein